jgi:L-fuconolactonase
MAWEHQSKLVWPMLKIDSHNHFWKYDAVRDSWITPDMAVIQRDFLPDDFWPVLEQNNFNGSVVVQSDQSIDENAFHLKNADENSFIKGIVGWVDLQNEKVESKLAWYQTFKKMKGFRHVLQGETDRALMLKPAFKNGIGLLSKYGFTYDILIFPDQLKYAAELVKEFPDQKFVVDHIAKPPIKNGEIKEWKKNIETVAKYENVYCKISGMVTEANWKQWVLKDFTPYIDTVVESFGTKRIMYGSDWPVCLVAASYDDTLGTVKKYFSSFSVNEQQLFFGGNATQFYNL